MKKVFMSLAIVALMGAAVACNFNTKKGGEATEGVEACTEVCDSCAAACDSCAKACCDSVVAEVAEVVEAVAE
jgi:hypothetical protein